MILITVTINATAHRVSDELLTLEHSWLPYVFDFSAPQYRIAKQYGGWVRLGFGEIALSPDLFASDWPPPKNATATVQYTASTEAAAVTLFSCSMRLKTFGQTFVKYEMFEPVYPQNVLNEGPNYDGETVPYPRAFGVVSHVAPIRLVDDGSDQPCYHMGELSGVATGVGILALTYEDAGAATIVTTTSAHGYSNGNSVYISGTVNFDGYHVIRAASGSAFTIDIAFPVDNSETCPLTAIAFKSGELAVFDDGVPIPGNVVVNGGALAGTFSLTASPVGTVTMSGTATETDLADVMTWGQGRLGITSIDTTNDRATSPTISKWVTNQQPLTEFLSDICAFFTHLYYIKSDTIYLVDMLLYAGTSSLTEFGYFSAEYSTPDLVGQISASWDVTTAGNLPSDDDTSTVSYLKTTTHTAIASIYQTSTGTADGTTSDKLVDSGATFSTDGIKVGYVARNTTDNTAANVTAVTETELTLDGDIFISGEVYVVGPTMPYANDMDIEPFHGTRSDILAALQNILLIVNRDSATVRVPITGTLLNPGKKLTFPDTTLRVNISTYIYTRNLTFDFLNHEVVIDGDGVIT